MATPAPITIEPLASLLADQSITEIMINGPDRIFIERGGHRIPFDGSFESEGRLRYAVERLLETAPGARVDMARPMVDLALPDGSRVNICIPPVVLSGPHITVRKFNRPVKTVEDFVALGTMDDRMAWFLTQVVRHGAAVLYSGASGTGKTTMLEVLARYIDASERIIVIEDTLELHLEQPNVVRMLGRAPNIENEGEITLGQLFRNCLRMRPNRILLGEIRGREVIDYLQAITSGHKGSQAIIHASTCQEALLRMEQLSLMAGRGADRDVVAHQILQGLDLVVQLDQHFDGVRRVTAIAEVVHDETRTSGLGLRNIYEWQPIAATRERVEGRYLATGHVPRIARKLELQGVTIPEGTFAADLAAQDLAPVEVR